MPLTAEQRIRGALLGAVVADAATRPLHWIYDAALLQALLEEREHPEFWPQSRSPFYTLPTGSVSAYADTTLLMLRTLEETDGELDLERFVANAEAWFGPGSPYALSYARRESNFTEGESRQWKGAIEGPWLHQCMRSLLENQGSGVVPTGMPNADETDGWMAALPILLLHREDPEVWTQVEQVIRSLAHSEVCARQGRLMGRVLNSAFEGAEQPVEEVLQQLTASGEEEDLQAMLRFVLDHRDQPHEAFVEQVGKACSYPGTLQGALHAFLTSSSYEQSVRKTIAAGGCNCSRANQVGALWGAWQGPGCISQAWIRSTPAAQEVERICDELLDVQSVTGNASV